MIARRVGHGTGEVAPVLRQHRADLVGKAAQPGQNVPPVLPGVGHGDFLVLDLLDRRHLHAGHGGLALVVHSVVIGVQEHHAADASRPGIPDILVRFVKSVVQIQSSRGL